MARLTKIDGKSRKEYREPLTPTEREELIDILVRDRMRWADSDPSYLREIFTNGYFGFAQMKDAELIAEYNETLREKSLDQ